MPSEFVNLANSAKKAYEEMEASRIGSSLGSWVRSSKSCKLNWDYADEEKTINDKVQLLIQESRGVLDSELSKVVAVLSICSMHTRGNYSYLYRELSSISFKYPEFYLSFMSDAKQFIVNRLEEKYDDKKEEHKALALQFAYIQDENEKLKKNVDESKSTLEEESNRLSNQNAKLAEELKDVQQENKLLLEQVKKLTCQLKQKEAITNMSSPNFFAALAPDSSASSEKTLLTPSKNAESKQIRSV